MNKLLCAVFAGAALAAVAGEFDLQNAEFAKYHKAITGRDAPEGLVAFAIDPKVSKSGRDAYTILSGTLSQPAHGANGQDARSPRGSVTITGSNMRSVWYGLYDLLERRGGCHWFWDGDVVPKRDSIDLSNLDVHEEAHYEYRAIRYFAHRGLTRFQAEHWGPEDWKKEIDWSLKRRLNVLMLRIGQDDLFQRTFPDVCEYPDPSKPLPGAGRGYDDRTLFWSLQYRGELRRRLQKYAFDRGLMMPEDFGTMTHWYSRTPEDFLEKKKPSFLPLSNGQYSERNGQVWDIRDSKWADEYWKMTTAAVEAYGKDAPEPRLLHTIGLGERMCYKDRQKNFDLKIKALDMFLARAHRDYPDAKVLLAGWDFYSTWKNEEVRALLPRLDPKRDIIWDYEADEPRSNRIFTNWGVMGKFPYTYSIFLAYEKALDARANYPLIEKRQKLVQNDPFCKGYIFWPESSHTDTLLLRFFTANAWADKPIPHGDVLDELCTSRYGANAEAMKAAWKAVLPASWLRDWGNNYSTAVLGIGGEGNTNVLGGLIGKWEKPVSEAEVAFEILQRVPWNDPFVQRDAIDIARMVLDRVIALRVWKFGCDLTKWKKSAGSGITSTTDIVASANRIAALCEKMADILALHTDYSLWESYQRLDAVEKIRNPLFEKTLFENSSCGYCRSHQYELARHWYAPHVKAVAENLAKAVSAGNRKAAIKVNAEKERLALKAKPLASLAPTLPRTEENFHRTLREIADLCGVASKAQGGVRFDVRRIGSARTEACGVADFNNDGRPDIIAGPYLYLAPTFRPVKVREVKTNVTPDGKGYANDFMNLPLDVNNDGRIDVISGDWFCKETWWIENALPSTNIWHQHLIERTGNIETGILVDIDGDGKATDILPDTQLTCLYTPSGDGSFKRDSVDNERCNMGRGCGDLNGDGRNDILTPTAWYEQLPGRKWRKHPLDVGFSDGGRALGHASNLIVYDVNRDGLADILVSSAHKYGIFWWEQLKEKTPSGELQFKKHVIDDTWTQAHYLGWGDIDGDGIPELVTGKRFMAHNGGDPDENDPLGVYYYDFTPGPDPVFKKHVITYNEGIGAGMNIVPIDIDGDGDVDLVTTGKWGGPVIFENKTK